MRSLVGPVDKLILSPDEPANWLELLRLSRAAFKQNDNADDAVIISRDADELRSLARSSMEPVVRDAAQASQDLMARQRGGVLLRVAAGPMPRPQLPPLRRACGGNADTLHAWNQQAAMLAEDGALPFQVAGIVTAVAAMPWALPWSISMRNTRWTSSLPSLARALVAGAGGIAAADPPAAGAAAPARGGSPQAGPGGIRQPARPGAGGVFSSRGEAGASAAPASRTARGRKPARTGTSHKRGHAAPRT